MVLIRKFFDLTPPGTVKEQSLFQRVWTYRYFDTPDGNDVFLKLFVTSKYALASGILLATTDTILLTHPVGLGQTAAVYLKWNAPLLGMAAAFTSTTHVSRMARGKDDPLNHFIGGLAAGSVFGAFRGTYLSGIFSGIMLGLIGSIKKFSIEEGFDIFPEPIRQNSTIWNKQSDFTYLKDTTEKGWTRFPDEA